MTDLFPNASQPAHIVKCDCQTKKIGGKNVKRPEHEQPTVILMTGIDPAFRVGSCTRCQKVHTVGTSDLDQRR